MKGLSNSNSVEFGNNSVTVVPANTEGRSRMRTYSAGLWQPNPPIQIGHESPFSNSNSVEFGNNSVILVHPNTEGRSRMRTCSASC
jgi:hypothetical protein